MIAEREEVALRAADLLRADAKWHEEPTLPDEDDLAAFLTSAPAETASSPNPRLPPCGACARPPLARSDLSPALPGARARWGRLSAGRRWPVTASRSDRLRLEVWTHSQGVYLLRRELARAFELAEDQVAVRHVEGSGCYGHNGADDAAMDAALLALAVPGRPVQVVWSRQDELGWAAVRAGRGGPHRRGRGRAR